MLGLLPSEHLSEHEIAAAILADQGNIFNPQQQFRVTWPAEPAVARAYLDQLVRSDAVPAALVGDLDDAQQQLDESGAGTRNRRLASRLESLADELEASDGAADNRPAKLAGTLRAISAGMR